jgi:hypothetical protein
VATKTSGVVWAVAASASALAFALLGGVIESTTELVRLWRDQKPTPAVLAPPTDAAPFDHIAMPAEGSLATESTGPGPAQNVRPTAMTTLNVTDGGRAAVAALETVRRRADASDDAPFSDATLDASDDSAASPASAALGTNITDASPDNASRAVAVAAQPPQAPPPPAQPVRCGWRICPAGQQCCNWNCSTCVSPGETCPLYCGAPTLPVSAPCGPNTCNVSEVCCNPSCGICVPPGGTCSKEPCTGIYLPRSVTCGMNTCNVGQVCCNPSCGICTNPGETCSLDPCS